MHPGKGYILARSSFGGESRSFWLRLRTERTSGFTLVELLYTISILGILSSLAVGSAYVYLKNAENAKAEVDLRTAKQSSGVFEIDNPSGGTFGLTWSNTTGGEFGGDLATMLPNGVSTKGVRVGALFNQCEAEDLSVKMLIMAQPCDGTKYSRWTRLCDNTEIPETNIPKDFSCG